MIQAISCPSASDLRRFLLGQSADQESAPLEEHLLHCEACLGVMQALPVDDPLISALRQGCETATPAPRSELLEKLRLRLWNRGPSTPGEDTAAGDNTGVPVSQPSAIEATEGGGLSLAPAQQPDEIGRLAGYRLLKELGRGGMGIVYQAEDIKLKRLVALKAMLPNLAADAIARQRFLREAQAMAAVRHDHVVTVFNVDEINGVPFLAMEFLQGLPLDKWLKEGRKPSVAQILRMGREIAEGLAAAHERGLIHRDVKPGNVWLDSAHKGRVKILDFGLARAGTEDVHLTRSGAIVGTPAYMAPEQARAEKVDARSDLFSLGCVLYKLCTGAMPFAGDTTMSLLMALALDHPKPVRELNPAMPAELSDLVTKLLEKDPARRPASAREVVQAIQALERRLAQKQDAVDQTETLAVAIVATPTPVPELSAAIASLPMTPRAVPPRRRIGALVAVVLGGALVAAAVVAIVIIVRDKNGNKVGEVNVPPGGKVEIVDDGKKVDTAVAPNAPLDEAWAKQVAAMPADKQVEAVVAELKKRNPGFDGRLNHGADDDNVVVALQFATADGVTDISPVKALTGLRSLTCIGRPDAKPDERAPLADLSSLKSLKLAFLNCSSTNVSDLSPLKDMKLTYLDCSYTRVSDLAPLKGMPLTHLEFGLTKVSDLSPLKGMKLTYLNCGVTKVSDLSPLDGMPLEVLLCSNLAFPDLSPLRGMPLKSINCDFKPERDTEILRSIKTLETINGKPTAEFWKDVATKPAFPPLDEAWAKKVRDLPAEKQVEEVAAELKRRNPGFDGKVTPGIEGGEVVGLNLNADNVTDVTPVGALAALRELICGGTKGPREAPLADLAPLAKLKLTSLAFINTRVTDLTPLRDMPLQKLNFGGTAITDLSPLKSMKLTSVECYLTRVSDLSPLKGMPLTGLACSGTLVSDLAPLKGMPLTSLNCGNTPVSDLAPLKDMSLTFLKCDATPISDLSPLKGLPLTVLYCEETMVSDLSSLKGMPLEALECDFKPERDGEILRSIKTLKGINEKPAAEFWKDVDAKKP